jgi:periplasmic glucans biosynthesis protein
LAPRRISGNVTLALSLVLLTVPAALLFSRGMRSVDAVAVSQVASTVVATRTTELSPQAHFQHGDVVELARRLAAEPPRPPAPITPGLEKLGYDQYRDIQFPIRKAIWTDAGTPFRLDLLPAGSVYSTPVKVSIVENGVTTEIEPRPGMFDLAPRFPAELRDKPLSISGFRVRALINSSTYWDEFLVFQGASYFRAVGQNHNYGLSARGLALKTGEPEGEEFPSFTQFWIEKPARNATALVIHALLESPSVTGAYRFTVSAGHDTTMDVSYTLFPRVELRNVGIAPLTSMFLFDASNRARFDDFRPRVHDSDGLMFETQSGERVYRQLNNGGALQLSAFTADRPRAFGLMQRARQFQDFQDLEANYERRPSAWVEFPEGPPPGPLRLVEIPTRNEANDNIVAFWQPRDPLPAGRPYSGTYRINWTSDTPLPRDMGRFVAARIGATMRGDRKLVMLDLERAGSNPEGLVLEVTSSAGTVFHPLLHKNPAIKGLRASFEFDPAGAPMAEFRAVVRKGERVVSETWLYRWTAS